MEKYSLIIKIRILSLIENDTILFILLYDLGSIVYLFNYILEYITRKKPRVEICELF